MLRLRTALLFGALSCMMAHSALAQQGTAEVRGRIVDQQGGVLPGVGVVITNQDTGVFRDVVTGSDGSYFAGQLLPGTFRITAELSGFRRFERRDFVVGVGRTATLDITLSVGAIEETVTVSASAPLVDLTSAEVGGTISRAELTDLPTGNRSYFAAVALLPGIQFSPSSSLGNDTMVANGQTTGGNSVNVDGGSNNDDSSGTGAGGQVRVPLESVSEFQVLTNQFDAEFGRARGAIINALTKQGTNQFRGVGYYYGTSDAMTAKDFFVAQNSTLTKPKTNKQEFGATLGGPIIKNKLHFFFSVEQQLVNPSRARNYPSRPDKSFTIAENWKALNTLIRVDHQINANNTWAIRWVREAAPQYSLIGDRLATLETLEDETDNDQIVVGSYTRLFGNAKVNTVRATLTSESFFRGNPCYRRTFDMALCPPEFEHLSFDTNQRADASGRDDENFQLNDTFSWYVPDKGGNHDFKFGATFHRTRLTPTIQTNLGGTFRFATDLPFNAADPRTYPERFIVRVGDPRGQTFDVVTHSWEAFFQDKWAVSKRLTLGLGVRYDLEVFPFDINDNPLIPSGQYPVDKNNVSPRTSFAYDIQGNGKSVVRGGYGTFYDKTLIEAIDNILEFRKFSTTFERSFPLNSADPGPSQGRFPTDPMLVNGPVVNRALLNSLFPPTSTIRNSGTVFFDPPEREQPWMHQVTIGYERELIPTISVSADYVRMLGRDMHLRYDINPGIRVDTSRTGRVDRSDAFGLLGEPYSSGVQVENSLGSTLYNGLNLMVEKRYSSRWAARGSYALAKAEGNTFQQFDTVNSQVGNQLNLDKNRQPSGSDRTHILTLSARTELPHTGGVTASGVMRYMSGNPFTIHNTNVDVDRNGILFDPIAPGTYSGAAGTLNAITVENDGGYGGARGPNFFQLDLRFGYRVRPKKDSTIDIFVDIFNITNYANFNNPSGDQRLSSFLILQTLAGGSGFPRQGQIGVRWGF